MSMIEIPDGDRTPIHFESAEILAVREDKHLFFWEVRKKGGKLSMKLLWCCRLYLNEH